MALILWRTFDLRQSRRGRRHGLKVLGVEVGRRWQRKAVVLHVAIGTTGIGPA
jgi:hypothetical protein